MSLDSYRSEHNRKLNELARLQSERSRLARKLADERKKEGDAQRAMMRTKSSSTLNSKQRAIETSKAAQARIEKDLASVDAKIARASKAANDAKSKAEKEEARLAKAADRKQSTSSGFTLATSDPIEEAGPPGFEGAFQKYDTLQSAGEVFESISGI